MTKLSLSRAWEETRERVRRDGNLYLSVALALLVLPQTVAGLVAPPAQLSGEQPAPGANALAFVALLIGLIGQLALVRLAAGPATSVGEAISHGARRLFPTLGALLLFALAVGLFAIPLIILFVGLGWLDASDLSAAQPQGAFGLLVMLLVLFALLMSVRVTLTVPVSSAEALGPVKILKRSWELTRGHYWRLLAFLLLILVAAIAILAVASLIGGILARLASDEVTAMSLGALLLALITAVAQAAFTILSTVMLARIYVQLAGGGAEASVPSSGT
jgi:hypothetical protein